jgi:TonB family protein
MDGGSSPPSGVDDLNDGQVRASTRSGTSSERHKGRWMPVRNFRSALEGCGPNIKPGQPRDTRVPVTRYLDEMHRRIHPLFAESLASLDALPPSHMLSDKHLVTRLEVVLGADGRIKSMCVVHASGVTAFDVMALDSVDRSQPFPQAPDVVRSADGNVYVEWDFHRDEAMACSTAFAQLSVQ